MKILLSIIFNALILYALSYLLSENAIKWIEAWITVTGWIKTYLLWWVILWLINVTIKPILKILSIPLFFVFLGLVVFITNWMILWLINFIFNELLIIPWVSYTINWTVNFIIAVAIFTFLNMFYSLLFTKK